MTMNRAFLPLLGILPLFSTAQDLPQPRPKAEVEQIVGLTKVDVAYSRPGVKGRKIFGDLVPFGEIWRLGANKCTTIEIDGPIKLEGQALAAGKYSVFATPNADAWEIIINRNTELWGADERKPEEDVLTLKVPVQKSELTETLTIDFQDVKDDKARMDICWENTLVSLRIEADATEKGIANIKEALAKPDVKFGAYASSARFYLDRNIDAKQALEWAKKSVEMEKKYWNTHTLALAQAANGLYKEAIATAEESLALAQEAKATGSVSANKARIEEWKSKL